MSISKCLLRTAHAQFWRNKERSYSDIVQAADAHANESRSKVRGDVIRGVECYRIRRMDSRSECTGRGVTAQAVSFSSRCKKKEKASEPGPQATPFTWNSLERLDGETLSMTSELRRAEEGLFERGSLAEINTCMLPLMTTLS